MEWIEVATHFGTFLFGAAVGAAGKYFADKYTDERHEKEEKTKLNGKFLEASNLMPALIAQMRKDVKEDASGLVREFAVLNSKNVMFQHSKKRFDYYFADHPELANMIDRLVASALVKDVNHSSGIIYEMADDFLDFLRK